METDLMTRCPRVLLVAVAIGLSIPACSRAAGQGTYTVAGANALVQKHDWNGLLAYANAWTHADPNDAMGWYYLGNTYGMGLHRPADALGAFQHAVALRSTWPEAWNALGFVNIELKHYDEAVTAFTHAAEQAPAKPNYRNNLAAAYSYAGLFSKALTALEDQQRAMSATATDVDWFNLGNGFCSLKEFDAAANAYRQALRLNPRYGAAWTNLGTLEGLAGNNQAALTDYQRGASLGDQLGASNYARLQQAIAAARQTSTDDPLKALWRSQAADQEYRARQAWQERLARAQG
jgi:protein O-GlcNAc transferase